MRIRKSQVDILSESHAERRPLARAREWAEDRPGAWVDDSTATAQVSVGEGRFETARFGPHGLIDLRTPEGRKYTLSYDDAGRLEEMGLVGESLYSLSYGESGQVHELRRGGAPLVTLKPLDGAVEGIEAHYADGACERLEYSQGRLTHTIDGAGGGLRLERDEEAMVTAVVDANGNATRFERDPEDPLGVTIISAIGTREVWASEEDELRVHVNGQLHGRVSGDASAERVQFGDGHSIEIEWDDDLPLKGRNKDVEVEFSYDGERRVVAERQGELEIFYTYDADGNLTAIRTSDGQEDHFSWDGDGMLSRVEDARGSVFRFEYAANGVVSRLLFPNGIETQGTLKTTLDGDHCTIRTSARGVTRPIVDERVQLDARGRAVRQHIQGSDLSYRYDGAGRLTERRDQSTDTVQSFAWDAAGNRVAVEGNTAVFDQCNRILQQGVETFSHDLHGRLVERTGPNSARYTYNGQGHLTTIVKANGETISFTYDPFGRRIRKTRGDQVTHFLWSGRQLLREWTVVGGRQIERRDYLFIPGEYHPLAVRIDDRLYCYHLDHTGTPVGLTNEKAALVWRARYDAFGRACEEQGNIRQPLRHLGQYCDAESGLHYNVFRYYDPTLGCYLTPDPLRFRSGNTNFYSYANGDPINQRDPDGHLVFMTALAIVAGAALVGGLIGGTISAATAEEGKRGEAFAKGFGWGALGGAVGAAVPLIGAAAGLGTAVIVGAALAADATVAGVEACTESGWDAGTFAKAAGISVGATVATMGLAKIPGVKRALRTLGNKVAGRGRQAYYKLFPGKLAKSRAARKVARKKAKEVARDAALKRKARVARAGGKNDRYGKFKNKSNVPKEYADDPRFDDLSADPDHSGKIDSKSRQEAMAGLEAEKQFPNRINPPIERGPKGIEFYDADGRPYDVKTPPSPSPGAKWKFKPSDTADSILKELRKPDYPNKLTGVPEPRQVILDSTYMLEANHKALWKEIEKQGTKEELARIVEVTTKT